MLTLIEELNFLLARDEETSLFSELSTNLAVADWLLEEDDAVAELRSLVNR